MADDITRLILKVESQQVELATKRLVEFTKAAKQAGTATSNFANKASRASTSTRTTGAAVDRTNRSMVVYGQSAKRTSTQLSVLSVKTTKATGATHAYSAGVVKAKRATDALGASIKSALGPIALLYTAVRAAGSVLSTTAEYEKFMVQLEAVTGSASAATEELTFLREVARENALVLTDTVAPYTRMAEAMRQLGLESEQSKKLFVGVSNAAATFGLSAHEVNGILIAFSQVASKGRVQAEELRNQIGERIPGAFSLAAKALGVTTEQLNKQLEMGLVDSAKFIQVYGDALQQEFGDNLANKTDTLGGSFRRLKSSVSDAVNEFSKFSGIGGATSKVLGFLDDKLKNVFSSLEVINELSARSRMMDISNEIAELSEVVSHAGYEFNQFKIDRLESEFEKLTGKLSSPDEATSKLREFINELRISKNEIDALLERRVELMEGPLLNVDRAEIPKLDGDIKLATYRIKTLTDLIEKLRDKEKELNEKQASEGAGVVPLEKPEEGGVDKMLQRQFDRLQESLLSEEEAIQASYARRLEIIDAYEEASGSIQSEAREDAKEKRDEDLADLTERLNRTRQEAVDPLGLAFETLEGHTKGLILGTTKWNMALRDIGATVLSTILNSFIRAAAAQLTAQVTTIFGMQAAATAAGAVATTASVASAAVVGAAWIAAGAAASIATLGMASGIGAAAFTAAMATGVVAATVAAAIGGITTTIAQGAGNVVGSAAVDNTTSGGYADGGIIPGSSFSGDNMLANVNSGEMILNASQQRKLFDVANGSGASTGQSKTTVNVINNSGTPARVQETQGVDGRMVEVIIGEVEQRIANSFRTGDGEVPRAMEDTYTLGRGLV